MKKLIILLLLIPLVSAQIQLSKVSYDISETIQTEIFFDNLVEDIKLENIQVTDLQGNKQSIQINLLKITDNHYYLFFEMNNQGSYILRIQNIKYKEHGILKQTSLMKNFEVSQQEKNISVFPAVFKYQIGVPTFSLKIRNNKAQAKTVKLQSNYTSLEFPQTVTIPGRTEQTTNIKLNPHQETNKKITINMENYTIPIFIVSQEQIKNIEFYLNNQKISQLKKEIKEKTTSQGTLEIKNNFDEPKEFSLKLTGNLNQILRISSEQLTINQKEDLELYINEEQSPSEISYKGNLQVSTTDYIKRLPIELTIIKEQEQPSETIESFCGDDFCDFEETSETCPEDCEEEIIEEPTEEPEEETTEKQQTKAGLVITIILIALLLIIILYVIRKPIKSTKPKYLK